MSIDSGLEQSFGGRLPEPGSLIADRYRLLELVGKGGMGAVYRAEHIQLQRNVAVKLLLGDYDVESQSFKRFQQEARTASMLDHPNIVRVHDFGVVNGRQPYLAMDYIAGVSLEDLLSAAGVLPLGRFAHIFAQACDAFDYAHLAGVIHRDIKPSNLMLVQHRKDADFLKIVDFGLVKLMSFDGADEKLTSTNTLVGSPLYMSPEQCRGRELDQRSDIYSLGCVMYRALSGSLPVAGESPLDTLYKHVAEEPLPISQVNPKLDCPLELERAIMKALSKAPDDRQQTMSELRAEIEAACRAEASTPAAVNVVQALAPTAAPAASVAPLRSTPTPAKLRKFNFWFWVGPPLMVTLFGGLIFMSMFQATKHVTQHITPVRRTSKPAVAVPSSSAAVKKAAPQPAPKSTPKSIPKPTPRPVPSEPPGHAALARGIECESRYQLRDAQAAFERALSEQESAYGTRAEQLLPVLAHLTAVCHSQRELDNTMLYFRRFTDIYTLHPDAQNVSTETLQAVSSVALDLARFHALRRRTQAAESYFKWAIELSKRSPDAHAAAQAQYDKFKHFHPPGSFFRFRRQ